MSVFDGVKAQSMKDKALQWIDENAMYYQQIVRKACEYGRNGEKFAIWRIVQDMRWDESVKIANGYNAHIARKLIEDEPWLAKFIRTRALKDEGEAVMKTSDQWVVCPWCEEDLVGLDTSTVETFVLDNTWTCIHCAGEFWVEFIVTTAIVTTGKS